MLTETHVRDLLARAAATIDVPPAAPVTPAITRRRRLLPALAAAAAVIAITVGTPLVLDNRSPGPAAPRNVDPVTGRIPSVFAYDADSAETMLTGEGLAVTRKASYTCLTEGRAVRTKPGPGTRFDPGDPVTLFVTEPSPAARCVRPAKDALAWQVLDFANGRSPAPPFASEVSVYVDGKRSRLSGDEAASSDAWAPDSALGLLATLSRQEERRQGFTATPSLWVHTADGNQFACGGQDLPGELAGRRSLLLSIEIPTDGIYGSCTFANLYQTDGRIDAIVVRTGGFSVEEQDPEPEPDPDPDGIGARFLAFARGEADSLPVDTPVRLYLGNQYEKTISAAQVTNPASWDLCAAYTERSCPMSAVATLREFEHQPAVTDFLPDGCLDTLTGGPALTGASRMVVLGVPEPRSCMDHFAVQIWYNDIGQITAVNLLFGSP